jgi:hypothetical protein
MLIDYRSNTWVTLARREKVVPVWIYNIYLRVERCARVTPTQYPEELCG